LPQLRNDTPMTCACSAPWRGEDSSESDVDILVTLDDAARPLDLLSLACDAEDILGIRVDVGTVENLRPEIGDDALNDAVLL
jgi:predicted nucleotidyltransferase